MLSHLIAGALLSGMGHLQQPKVFRSDPESTITDLSAPVQAIRQRRDRALATQAGHIPPVTSQNVINQIYADLRNTHPFRRFYDLHDATPLAGKGPFEVLYGPAYPAVVVKTPPFMGFRSIKVRVPTFPGSTGAYSLHWQVQTTATTTPALWNVSVMGGPVDPSGNLTNQLAGGLFLQQFPTIDPHGAFARIGGDIADVQLTSYPGSTERTAPLEFIVCNPTSVPAPCELNLTLTGPLGTTL